MSKKKDYEITRKQFKATINRWHKIVSDNGVVLPRDEEITTTFFKVMIGVKRRVFQEWYQGQKHVWQGEGASRKKVVKSVAEEPIPNYATRCIYYIEQLSEAEFIEEVRKCIPHYLKTKQA